MNNRLKKLRKILSLSQEEFGKKINLSKPTISALENQTRGITDRVISDICETFNVNEEWLRNGTGEMFCHDEKTALSQLATEYHLDNVDCRIIESYLQLGETQRKVMKEYLKLLVAAFSSEAAAENNIDEEVKSYRRELEQEKSIETSEASQDSNSKIG